MCQKEMPKFIHDNCPSCSPTQYNLTIAKYLGEIEEVDGQENEYLYACVECGAKLWVSEDWALKHAVKEPKPVGRPSVGTTKKVSLTLADELWDLLDQKKEEEGISQSALLRKVVEERFTDVRNGHLATMQITIPASVIENLDFMVEEMQKKEPKINRNGVVAYLISNHFVDEGYYDMFHRLNCQHEGLTEKVHGTDETITICQICGLEL